MRHWILLISILCLPVFSEMKYKNGSNTDDDKIAKEIEKDKLEAERIRQQQIEEEKRQLSIEKEKILKEVEESEKDRQNTLDEEERRKKSEITVQKDTPTFKKREKMDIKIVLTEQIGNIIYRIKKDLSKTSRLDLFNLDTQDSQEEAKDVDEIGEKEDEISLFDPKPLPGQTEGEFKKMLLIKKNEARKNQIKAMILDVTYNDSFEENFGSFVYEKVSREQYYTKYPQEIQFTSCYSCVYSNRISIQSNEDGGLSIEKNEIDLARVKSIQQRYDLDMYARIYVSYSNRTMYFQVQFYSAKTNNVIWSRSYSYYLNSLLGRTLTVDLGVNFMVSFNKGVPQNPIGADIRVGGRFLGVGTVGGRFYLGGGFNDNLGAPQLYMLNGFFDFAVTDLIPDYGNRVGFILGTDMGIGIQTFLNQPLTFFNFGFSSRVTFLQSAFLMLGVQMDVGQGLAGTKFDAIVGPAFVFGIGVIFL